MTGKKAGDLMIPLNQYPHIPYWFTLRQAIAEIEHSVIEVGGRKSLPRYLLVFDETYQLVGIVRRRDILHGLEPKFLSPKKTDKHHRELFDIEVDPHLFEMSSESMSKTLNKNAETAISEVMQPIESTVNHDDHITFVITKLVSGVQSLLPVLENKKVVGVIRTVDVFKEISNIVLSG